MNSDKFEAFYPLSPMQAAMLDQMLHHPEPGLYVIQSWTVGPVKINPDLFQAAWQIVVDRHPVLRTSFMWEGVPQPVQVVHRRVQLQVSVYDWRGLDRSEVVDRMDQYAYKIRLSGFDLRQAPHMHLALMRLEEEGYLFSWSFNYMLQDGWSFPLLMNEFFTAYDALSDKRAVKLPEPRPYRDFIVWLYRQDRGRAEEFWRQRLHGFEQPVSPIIDPQPDPVDRYVKKFVSLSSEETACLTNTARRLRVTVNTLVEAAWAIVISRRTGKRDVVFGEIVSGRPPDMAGIEHMVGFFLNILPARIILPETGTLDRFLPEVQDRQVQMREFDYAPPDRFKQWSSVQADVDLFDNYLVFENFPQIERFAVQSQDWGIAEMRALAQTEHPLRIEIFPGVELIITMSHNRQRFGDCVVRMLLDEFRQVLVNVAVKPDRSMSELLGCGGGDR